MAKAVYLATEPFPSSERFGLAAQMRRAAVSVGSNICEGCGREGDRELTRYLQIAYGSVSELQFQAALAVDLSFLSAEHGAALLDDVTSTKKMLSRLIKSLRTQGGGGTTTGGE